MRVYRLGAASFSRTRKQAFSGEGGLHAPGRWHSAGRLIIYTSQSLSLAALEILVHLKQNNHIHPFCSYSAEIPDALVLKPDSLPRHWRSRLTVSRRFGDGWLQGMTSPALLIPSAVTRGEWNVLLNPGHPQFSPQWIVSGPTTYSFNPRLLPFGKR
jgi:RES domain-containing protein